MPLQARGLGASAGQAKVDICPKELILSERLWLVLESLKVVLIPTCFIPGRPRMVSR